jgi:aminomethyltransferase
MSAPCSGEKGMVCLELKTALYDVYSRYGAKVVPFAGYLLPVQYETGITAEHMAVRQAAGLFDVSHMAELVLKGSDALNNIQMLLTNDFSSMADGQIKYSPMCNEKGGFIDDLLVYRKSGTEYLLVVNAGNHNKVAEHVKSQVFGDCLMLDESANTAQLALQGPRAGEIIKKIAEADSLPVKYYTFTEKVTVAGVDCLVSRTGYTGEDGYELYMPNCTAVKVWDALMEAGEEFGLIPCGLGARDTLRLEAGMPLYGHEINEDITPFEAGLGMFVKMEKTDFIGRTALAAAGAPVIKRIGLELTGRGIARQGDTVVADEKEVGTITSGTLCPYVNKAVAMALVSAEIPPEAELTILVRGRTIPAKQVQLPFYKRSK